MTNIWAAMLISIASGLATPATSLRASQQCTIGLSNGANRMIGAGMSWSRPALSSLLALAPTRGILSE